MGQGVDWVGTPVCVEVVDGLGMKVILIVGYNGIVLYPINSLPIIVLFCILQIASHMKQDVSNRPMLAFLLPCCVPFYVTLIRRDPGQNVCAILLSWLQSCYNLSLDW